MFFPTNHGSILLHPRKAVSDIQANSCHQADVVYQISLAANSLYVIQSTTQSAKLKQLTYCQKFATLSAQ